MSYATLTDYWGFADTNRVLQASNKTGVAGGNAQALDSIGDVQCETVYGETYEYEARYKLINGDTETLATVPLGKHFEDTGSADPRAINAIEVSTSNTDYPEITISGRQVAYDSAAPTWSPAISVQGIKEAQAIGFVAAASTFVNSSSVSLSLQTEAVVLDSEGDFATVGFGGGRKDCTGELTACSVAPSAVADTANGYALSQPVSVNSENTAYQTATVETFKNILQDT
jgi:hypothetical protein